MEGELNMHIPNKLLNILCCTECGNRLKSEIDVNGLKCQGCGHFYKISREIPDLTPSGTQRKPKIFNDKEFTDWNDNWTPDKADYFYNCNRFISWIQNAGHRKIKSLTAGKQYDIMLDLACGNGAHYPFISHPENAFGLDIDQKKLLDFRRKHPDFFVIRGDGYQLPILDGAVDCIFNVYNLEHMVYLDLALEEMRRVLTDGGDIFISVPNEGGLLWTLGRNLTSMRHFKAMNYNYGKVMLIIHINCIQQLDRAIRRSFVVKKIHYFPFLISSLSLNLMTTYHCVKK